MDCKVLKSVLFQALFIVLSVSIIPLCYAGQSRVLVDNDSNGIKIVSVEKTSNSDINGETIPSGHIQINVAIDFIRAGDEWKLSALNSKIYNENEVRNILSTVFLLDSEDHKYNPSYSKVTRWAGGSYSGVIFIVPENSKGLKLGYQDLLPIDLDL